MYSMSQTVQYVSDETYPPQSDAASLKHNLLIPLPSRPPMRTITSLRKGREKKSFKSWTNNWINVWLYVSLYNLRPPSKTDNYTRKTTKKKRLEEQNEQRTKKKNTHKHTRT